MQKKINLTEGGIVEKLVKIAIPIMATSFIQIAYNLIDMMWVGKNGSNSVAAVGTAGFYPWLAMAFVMFSKIGGEVKVAQSMGEKNIKEVKSYIKSSIELNVFLSLTYSLILILFNKQLIRIFINDEATTVIAASYLSAVAFSQIFSAIEMISNGMFTGIGKPKIPATISIIFTSFRIPLAILLIKPFGISGIWISICVSSILKGISSYLIYEVKIKRNL